METRILLIFSLLAFFASEISSQNTACETGWSSYGGDCYKIFQRNRVGLDAQKSCVSEGGNLVKISSWAQWLWLQSMSQLDSYGSLFTSYIYVGAYAAHYKQFYWLSDGSSLDSNYWCNSTSEPNGYGGSQFFIQENCVASYKAYISSGSNAYCLRDIPCSDSRYYWCQRPAVASTTTPKPTTCNNGWIAYNGHCYQAFNSPYMTGFQAQQACIAIGAYLMQIDNNDEFLWAQSSLWKTLLNKGWGTNYWLGGYSFYPFQYYWIKDNTPLSKFSNWWYNGEPSNGGNNLRVLENCVTTWYAGYADGGLNDYPCGVALPYICEMSA